MIFAFIEDGTLAIHADIAEVQREYEGIDVESGVIRFYDASGTYLEPIFTTPNRISRRFLLFTSVLSGTYDLRAAPNADEDPIWVYLVETSSLEPNPYFATVAEVKAYFDHCFPTASDEEQSQ